MKTDLELLKDLEKELGIKLEKKKIENMHCGKFFAVDEKGNKK